MTSSRTSFTSSGVISGSGLAMAKMIGFFASFRTISLVNAPLEERPKRTSAPTTASSRVRQRGVDGEPLLVLVHPLAPAFVDDPLGVAHDQVFRTPERHDEVGAGDGGSAGAVDDDPDVFDVLADDLQSVDERRRGDDGRAVLVVVEHRDVHGLLELLLDVEALRGLDVLQVDPAKGRLQELADLDDLIGVFRVDLDVEHVDVGKALEENPFPFHDRLAGECADIAKAEDRGAVRNNRHQVPFGGVSVGIFRVLFDFQAGFGNAGRIGQGKIAGSDARFGGDDLDLPFASGGMVVQRILTLVHGLSPWLFIPVNCDGNVVQLIPRSDSWNSLFGSLKKFSRDFMTERVQPELDKRESF